ncbi:phosphoribosylaminoimidazolesuccinocarboxamide synthase [bacterium]|nr:phosphoribosylaminoimidazolesuccinocarboxamide synthase [bacterium]
MGSVKDLVVLQKPAERAPGTGNFVFSDRYSVFDWGEMPDHIVNKGKALCMIGGYFFEKVEDMGIRTHYLGLVENGSAKRLSEINAPVDTMQVRLLRVIKPTMTNGIYGYSAYKKSLSNFLVPLEVIYRNSLPEGSSVFKRLRDGVLKPEEIGLSEMPVPGQNLSKPILDVSTKLEATDRYMTWQEAESISRIGEEQIQSIKEITLRIDALITEEAKKMGLVHEDGKLEFGIDENDRLVVVDIFGTPDECRFTFEGIPVSKEAARRFYRKTDWFKEAEKAKQENRLQWKSNINAPPPLPERLSTLISQLYMSFCNDITERTWFDVPSLKEIMYEVRGFVT